MINAAKSKRKRNKDLHISFRVNADMLGFYESLVNKVNKDVGMDIAHSKIMRALLAVAREDEQLRGELIARITDHIKRSSASW